MVRIFVVLLSVILSACAGQSVSPGLNSALGGQGTLLQPGDANKAKISAPKTLLSCIKELTSSGQDEAGHPPSLLAYLIRVSRSQNSVPTATQFAINAEALEVAGYVRSIQAKAAEINRPAISLHLENKSNDRLCLEQQTAYWQRIAKSEQNKDFDTPQSSPASKKFRMLTASLATLDRIYAETNETVSNAHPQEVGERLARSYLDKTLYLPASVIEGS
ncbi:MAG: hypothetical protein ACR2OW_14295 [Methyloligellaceae bacterium]